MDKELLITNDRGRRPTAYGARVVSNFLPSNNFNTVFTFVAFTKKKFREPATEKSAPSLEERQRSFTVARQLLNEGSFEQASLILEELIETDDEIGNFAMILLYRTRAGAGEEGLIDQIENQGKVEIKPQPISHR